MFALEKGGFGYIKQFRAEKSVQFPYLYLLALVSRVKFLSRRVKRESQGSFLRVLNLHQFEEITSIICLKIFQVKSENYQQKTIWHSYSKLINPCFENSFQRTLPNNYRGL